MSFFLHCRSLSIPPPFVSLRSGFLATPLFPFNYSISGSYNAIRFSRTTAYGIGAREVFPRT